MFHSDEPRCRVSRMSSTGVGFWKIASESPDRVAVVEPDGTEISAGRLLAGANQLVHALRGLGLAARQAGWYITPINWHLTAPEIAYILDDSDAAAVIASPRAAGIVTEACATIDFPAAARFVSGALAVSGFR